MSKRHDRNIWADENLIDSFKHASLGEFLSCSFQKLDQAILSEVLPVANSLKKIADNFKIKDVIFMGEYLVSLFHVTNTKLTCLSEEWYYRVGTFF